MLSLVRRHPIITFFVLTFAIGWGCIPFWTFQAGSPFIAALIVIPLTQGWAGLVQFSSVSTILLVFGMKLINPGDGPLGEEPGWRGFALPGLQSTLSPLVSTLILGALVTVWHAPLLFLEEGLLRPYTIVGFLLGTFAVTFWYTWLFNLTGGSVLMTLIAHAAQGTITIGGFWSLGTDFARANLLTGVVWLAVAIGLVVLDRKAWLGPAAAETRTPEATPPRAAAPT